MNFTRPGTDGSPTPGVHFTSGPVKVWEVCVGNRYYHCVGGGWIVRVTGLGMGGDRDRRPYTGQGRSPGGTVTTVRRTTRSISTSPRTALTVVSP